jgi:hypothetical protein
MLEGAGFSRSNPYYIVKQGKVCLNKKNLRNFNENFFFYIDYSNGYCTRCKSTSIVT